jgi:hypothetical protein
MIAQIDPELAKLIPSKWTPYVIGAVLALPYLTRGWHGWQNAGGLRGLWGAVMNGTNTPKDPRNYGALRGLPPSGPPPAAPNDLTVKDK